MSDMHCCMCIFVGNIVLFGRLAVLAGYPKQQLLHRLASLASDIIYFYFTLSYSIIHIMRVASALVVLAISVFKHVLDAY